MHLLKKLDTIFLLSLLLFNLAGYKAWFYYQQMQSDQQFQASLDKDAYNENDLITIKIPLSLPYLNTQKDFERVNGEITLNGKIYKYVKRKICDGNLILLCLPDENKMRLQNAKDEFFKFANDLQQNSNSKKSGTEVLKNISSDYVKTEQLNANFYISHNINFQIPQNISIILSGSYLTPEQPPELTIA